MASDEGARRFPVAVFYGDSIITGHEGISSPRARWSSLVCEELQWREVNLAINGMGFYRFKGPRGEGGRLTPSATDTTLLDAAIRLNPDVVIVCLSANDMFYVDDHRHLIEQSARRDLSRFVQELPGVPVVAVSYFPGTDLPPRCRWLIENLARVSREVGVTYLDGMRYVVGGNLELLADDEIHPNDAGHRALADCVIPELRALHVVPTLPKMRRGIYP